MSGDREGSPRYLARSGRASPKADQNRARGYTEQHWRSIDHDDDATTPGIRGKASGPGEERQELLEALPQGDALAAVDDEWLEWFGQEARRAAVHDHAAIDIGLRNPSRRGRHSDSRVVFPLTRSQAAAAALVVESAQREHELRELEQLIRQRSGSTYHSPHRLARRYGGIQTRDEDGELLDPFQAVADDVAPVAPGGVRGPKPSGSRLDATARRYLVRVTGLTPEEMRSSLGRSRRANREHREWVTLAVPAVRTVSSPGAIRAVLNVSRSSVWRLHDQGRATLAALNIDPTIEDVERHIAQTRSTACCTTTA